MSVLGGTSACPTCGAVLEDAPADGRCPYCAGAVDASSLRAAAGIEARVQAQLRAAARDRARAEQLFAPGARLLGAVRGLSPELACPVCGAHARRVPGKAIAGCAHCGAALVPPTTELQRLVADARHLRRTAGRTRAEAEWATGVGQGSATSGMHNLQIVMFGLGGMGLMLMLSTLFYQGMADRFAGSPRRFVLYGMIGLLALAGTTVGVASVGYVWFQRRRAKVLRAAIADLAVQLRGRLSHRDSLFEWLHRHWGGYYPGRYLALGPGYGAAELSVLGLPCAMIVDLVGATAAVDSTNHPYVSPFAHVLVAAPLDPARVTPEAQEIHAWLNAAGFRVHLDEGGLWVDAGRDAFGAIAKSPSLVRNLAPVAMQAARLALELADPR